MNNYRTQVVIDKEALLYNINRVKEWAPHSNIVAMVKANAYGHGMEEVSRVLHEKADVFGVACLKEALKLRLTISDKPILLMGGIFADEEWMDVFDNNLDVIFQHYWQMESFFSFLSKNSPEKKINIWIKIDTGMHRLGFDPNDVFKVYPQFSQCSSIHYPINIMTHFACADDVSNPMTSQQIEWFNATVKKLSIHFPTNKIKCSLANSAGIMAWPASHGDYVRPGIMLYGISPFTNKTGMDLDLKPVMSLQSHIIAIKTCKKEETVGYGATWHAKEDCPIAIVAAGYGDGYPRHVSKEAVVWINGRLLPIIGRVSMDTLAINITDYPEVSIGQSVELWGKNLPVEKVAYFAGTSPYELVTQMTNRPR